MTDSQREEITLGELHLRGAHGSTIQGTATLLADFLSSSKSDFPLHYYITHRKQEHVELHSGSVQSFQPCSAALKDSNPRITFIFYLLHKQCLAAASSYLSHRLLALSEQSGLLFWSFVLLQFAVFSLLEHKQHKPEESVLLVLLQ